MDSRTRVTLARLSLLASKKPHERVQNCPREQMSTVFLKFFSLLAGHFQLDRSQVIRVDPKSLAERLRAQCEHPRPVQNSWRCRGPGLWMPVLRSHRSFAESAGAERREEACAGAADDAMRHAHFWLCATLCSAEAGHRQ